MNADLPITRYVYIINLKMGADFFYKSGWAFEWFVGVGLRHTNSLTNMPLSEYNGIFYSNDYAHTDNANQSQVGSYFSPNVTAGVKIGFRVL